MVGVIPVKPLHMALGRLSGVLGGAERLLLQREMLTAVLEACAHARLLDEVLVVTDDGAAAELACGLGARVVPDHTPPRGMNPAVVVGCAAAAAAGADGALVLTADLPLVRPDDLDALLAAAPPGPSVVLAPSRDGTGTNAMLLCGPRVLEPELGLGSLARHEAQAIRRGIAMAHHHAPGIALDVDTPDDLATLWRDAPEWARPAPAGSAPMAAGGAR